MEQPGTPQPADTPTKMPFKAVRVGFVGLGGICRSRHVPGLQRIEGVDLVAVANRSRPSGERAAAEFEIPHVASSWGEIVTRDDVDAVFIGTWPYLHHRVSLAALHAGKHVFCQARMAMNGREAREMYDAATRSGCVAMICPVPIGLSVDATLARLLHEGYLGDIRLVRVHGFSNAYAAADAPMNWRKDHRLSGLNMGTLGMYIEVMHRWFGWTRAVRASAQTFVPERLDTEGRAVEVRIPDQFLFQAEMEQGFPVQYTVSTAVHHGADAIEIYGSEGTLRYEVGPDVLYGARADEAFQPVAIQPEDAYDVAQWRVEEDFIRAIREGAEYHPNFEDGLRYMQVIEAVYASAASGREVELEE